MKLSRLVATAAGGLVLAALAGCGGGHALTPGQAEAATACRSTGSAAALAATKAAAVNPGYSKLAADENALAAGESTQVSAVSDGTSTGDADAGALAAGVDLGSAARQKVIDDCFDLGLPVAHS